MVAKGRRQRLKGEDEFDVVDQFWRRFFGRYSIKKAA